MLKGSHNDRRHIPRRIAGERPDPDLGALRPGRRMGQRLDRAGVRMGADMKIEAGKYYRTRGGDIVGPMREEKTHSIYPWVTTGHGWTISGRFSANSDGPLDLISEVYVSDTPPAPQVNTTKTARDELVEKAALEILNGCLSKQNSTLWHSEIWLMAEQFVEARKK
jgi:hypothetical protein